MQFQGKSFQAMTGQSVNKLATGFAFIIAGMASAVTAQTVVPDAGSTLRQLDAPTVALPGKNPPIPRVAEPAPSALQNAPALRFKLNEVRITGATVFSQTDFLPLVQPYVGREVDFAALNEIAAQVTRFYTSRGYPLATAYLPAQDIKDGAVELIVLEGRFGKVDLQNRSLAKDPAVVQYLQDLPGQIVTDAILERALLLVYDLSGVVPAQAVLLPGANVGETDLRVELTAGASIAGSVELDNHGGRFTGANRISGALDVSSPAGWGDRFSVRLTQSDPGLTYARLGYKLPLGGSGWVMGADYSHTRYRLGKEFSVLDASGTADTWSVSATYPLLRARDFSLYARAGLERKEFQDRVRATSVLNDKSSRLTTLALTGDFVDGVGGGSANAFALTWSGGDMNIETAATKAIDAATARTDGGFHKWNLNYLRAQTLSGPLSAFVSLSAQKASKNLDSSEKMFLGGTNGVRAYPQGEAPGDSGYLLTGELRYGFKMPALPGAMELVGFVDIGSVKTNENPFIAGANRRNLSGGGLGLNWNAPNDFSLRLSLAHRIGDAAATVGDNSKTRGWLQLVKRF